MSGFYMTPCATNILPEPNRALIVAIFAENQLA